MARPLRIEYPGAWYHVMNRGRRKEEINTYSRSGVLISGGGLNHFHRDYRLPGEMWTVPQLDKQKAAFKCAQKLFEANGRIIVNASRKTKLNVFRQVNLNTVLNSNVGEL
jgi:hypothetical protein